MAKPFSPRFWWLLAGSVASLCSLLILLWLVAGPPDLERASRRARELEALLWADPRFGEARVEAFSNGQLVVYVPESLPATVKTDLIRVVTERGPRQTVVSYTVPLSGPH